MPVGHMARRMPVNDTARPDGMTTTAWMTEAGRSMLLQPAFVFPQIEFPGS
jgi:hypothetical protein